MLERVQPDNPRPDRVLVACRHALIGLTIESERRLKDHVASLARGGVRTLRNPVAVEAWKARVAQLVKTGRTEEEHAVASARAAVDDLFGTSLPALVKRSVATAAGWVASSPEVQELVRTQTSGAADAAASRLREDSAQADAHVERRVRSLLRRSPRDPERDPEPPTDTGLADPEGSTDATLPPAGHRAERDASNHAG